MIFDEESASDAQKFLAPPKLVILEKQIQSFAKKHFLMLKKNGVNFFSRILRFGGARNF